MVNWSAFPAKSLELPFFTRFNLMPGDLQHLPSLIHIFFVLLLKVSPLGAVLTPSWRLFHLSTVRTAKEYFRLSVWEYCTGRQVRFHLLLNKGNDPFIMYVALVPAYRYLAHSKDFWWFCKTVILNVVSGDAVLHDVAGQAGGPWIRPSSLPKVWYHNHWAYAEFKT